MWKWMLETVVMLNQPPLDITAKTPAEPSLPIAPEHLIHKQTKQLQNLLQKFRDIFATSKADQGRTQLLHQEIQTEGPPIRLPYRCQNPIV